MFQYNLGLFIIKQDIRKLLDSEKDSVTENMTNKKLIELYLERESVWEVCANTAYLSNGWNFSIEVVK